MSRPRVLIVEDELVVGLDLEHRLVEMGNEVVAVVPSGLEAIDEAVRSSPDLVLMDIKLSGEMDGVEAARRIREVLDVPIVFVTAFADETTTKRVKAVAPYGYVVKPFQKEALRVVVETALTRHEMSRRLEQGEREQRFLADLGTTLASTLDCQETLIRAARIAVPDLADWCILDVYAPDGPVRLEVVHADPAKAAACEALERLEIDPERPHLASSVLQTKQPALVSDVSREYLESVTQGDEHLRLLLELEPRSIMTLPLMVRGELGGCLVLGSSRPSRRFTAADLRFAEHVAYRIALAVDNAQLYEIAQRAIQARDEVLGIVAHDLRNPLNAILMQLELLREKTVGNSKALEATQRAAQRMNRMIRELLDVARIEAGTFAVEPGRVEPAAFVRDAVDSQRPAAVESLLELTIDVSGGLPAIWGERDVLGQILDNLIGNAIKFTRPGGHITVGASPREREVLFWVADTGVGVKDADLPHLFDRFWQAKRGDRRGAGLGLSIVKGIVEAHGGRVWAESVAGRGTTVFFTIPAAPRLEQSLSGSASAPC